MQDLFENHVSELTKLREAFQNELGATSEELSQAMDMYARRGEAALAAFMEKVSASGMELEAAAEARLNQFRGLPSSVRLPNVDDGPIVDNSTNGDRARIADAVERATAEILDVENDGDHRPQPGRPMALVKSGTAA
jgi:hypothetical protein